MQSRQPLRRRPRRQRHRRRRPHPRRLLPRPPPRRAGGQDHPQGEQEEEQGKQEGQCRSEALLFRHRLLLRLRSAAPDRRVRLSRIRRLVDLRAEEEAPPAQDYPLWKVQTAVTWPHGTVATLVGSANVGKSAFINALLKMMARKDPVAAAAQKYKPMQSAVPGTTLGPIQIEAFQGGGKLFDTPGVHLHHRQAVVVHSEDLPTLAPQSRLRGFSFPVLSAKNIKNDINAVGLNGISIFWGGLVRIDVLKVLPTTRLTFYEPLKVPILTVRDVEADEFYQREVGVTLTPPSGKQREIWPGLQVIRHLQIKFEDGKRPACDIAISGRC